MKHIAIIGNGISGITCARHIRKLSDHKISVISGETRHFFSRTALMYIYMGHMKYEHTKPYEDWFWEKNRIDLVYEYVEFVDTANKKLRYRGGGEMDYDVLVIASGSSPNKFGWPGQDLKGVQGLYSYQDLETMEMWTKNCNQAVIVGGGLIGIEMAEMLRSREIEVTFLVRESNYWSNVLPDEESKMISRHISEHHIDLRLETELKEIKDNGDGWAQAVVTNKGEEIPCQFVGLTAGVHPNITFLLKSGIETDRGVMINRHFETNAPDVYAIGDCAQFRDPLPNRRPLEQVWYTGRMHGETLAKTICGEKTAYTPSHWFNSAKFLDIEYQVYGEIPSTKRMPENIDSLYWESKSGKESIRINYEKESMRVTGFNLMGIRYRHHVCEKWLDNRATLEEVLVDLEAANFDPEFYKVYEPEVIALYNQKTGNSLKPRRKRGWKQVLEILKS